MILGHLRVREKLTLLLIVPFAVVVLLLVPLLAGRTDAVRDASRTATEAEGARAVSGLVEELQRARVLSVVYLDGESVPPSALLVQLQDLVQSRTRALEASRADAAGGRRLLEALGAVDAVPALTQRVVAREASATEVLSAYGDLVDRLTDGLDLVRRSTQGGSGAASLASLDALLRADELAARSATLLLLAAGEPRRAAALVTQAQELRSRSDDEARRFEGLVDDDTLEVWAQIARGPGETRIADATARLALLGDTAAPADLRVDIFAAVQSRTGLRQLLEGRVAQDVAVDARAAAGTARATLVVLAVVVVALAALVLALSIVVGRSVVVPLRRLTAASARVTDLTRRELQRVVDEDEQEYGVPRLPAIEVTSADEVGEMARAFNGVQAGASALLERQVASRRNVAAMFDSIGRRTSNLVGRQLALIDSLERGEEDPDTLATLYRLDHVSTRLRRNADSLVLLSAGPDRTASDRPLPLPDAVRAAVATVEEYTRVTLHELPDVTLAPAVAGDFVLLLAELIENGLTFSPADSEVVVATEAAPDGSLRISVADSGLGMPQARLEEENARLRGRERLDLAPTDVLGLFVVGRIARRHGLDVRLEPGDPGTVARLLLPAAALLHPVPPVPSRPVRTSPSVPSVPVPSQSASRSVPADDAPPSMPRRLPGAAMAALEGTDADSSPDEVRPAAAPAPGSGPPAPDPADTRRQLLDLQAALADAGPLAVPRREHDREDGAPPRGPAADVRPGVLGRRVPGQALSRLSGEPPVPPAAVPPTAVLPAARPPVPEPPAALPPVPEPPAAARPAPALPRRVPGESWGPPKHVADGGQAPRRRVGAPQAPQDARDWMDELERALAQARSASTDTEEARG